MKKYCNQKHRLISHSLWILILASLIGVTGCGDNDAIPKEKPKIKAIAAGEQDNAVLYGDGTVSATLYLDWEDVVSIDVGDRYKIVGLKKDGKVVATKDESDYHEWRDLKDISTGPYIESVVAGLRNDGTVITDAPSFRDEYDPVKSWMDIVQIDVGSDFIIGLKKDGTVVAAGKNEHGQCDVDSWKNVKQISAGGSFTAALTADGKILITKPLDDNPELNNAKKWENVVEITAGNRFLVGISSDGSVIMTDVPTDMFTNFDVSSWADIVHISAGSSHLLGLKSDGTVLATGYELASRLDVTKFNQKD